MRYEKEGQRIGRMVDIKNQAYGNSFSKSGDILKILFPRGVRPDQYKDLLAITRILDKLFRIATDETALGENPWNDIAGYGILKSSKSNDNDIERIIDGDDNRKYLPTNQTHPETNRKE